MEFRKAIMRLAATAMSVIVAVLAGMLTLTTLPMIETAIAPVVEDWQITEVRKDGYDLIVSGVMTKRRDCAYIPPPRARDAQGINLVVHSANPTAVISWPASDTPQSFAPWRVVNGADREVEFFLNHSCHSLYTLFTRLGKVSLKGSS